MRLIFAASLLALLLAIPFTAQAASQIAPRDGLWLSLPPDTVKCVVLRLPQDAGLPASGHYMFSVSCEPGPSQSWADLSEQIVREVHENNTVLIPVCFDTAGAHKTMGNCSEPYTITLEEQFSGTMKHWSGGICVSEFADADIAEPVEGVNPEEQLNSNLDVFSAWFVNDRVSVLPGETADFNLSAQANAVLELSASIVGQLAAEPSRATLKTGPSSPLTHAGFSVQAPLHEGEYPITARVSVEGCEGTHCSKDVRGTLVVGEDSQPDTGFTVRLRPESIDVKEPEPVIITMTVSNDQDSAAELTTSLSFDPDDARSGFSGETVEIGPYDTHTRVFTVTPGESSRLYELTAVAESGGLKYSATSFITIDEMLTDALRQAEGVEDDQAMQELDSFLSSHEEAEHGSDLQDYGSLRDTLANAGESQGNQSGDDWYDGYRDYYDDQQGQEESDSGGWMWFALPIILIAAVVVVLLLVLKGRSSGGEEDESGTEYY